MKKAFTWMLATVMLMTITACSGGTPSENGENSAQQPEAASTPTVDKELEPVTLRFSWWGGQARHDYTLQIIELYEERNPHVKIEAEYAALADYWKKLAPQAAANDLPDIIQINDSRTSEFGGRGQLEDLRPYLENGMIDTSAITEDYLKIGEYDGHIYQMSLGVNAMGPVIDADLLEQIGESVPARDWTWDDAEALAEKLKAHGKLISDRIDFEEYFPYYLRSLGQMLFSPDGTSLGYADDQPFIDYFERYQRWYDAGYVLPLDKMAQKRLTPEDDEMVLGNAGVSWAWSNQYITYTAAAKRATELIAPPGNTNDQALYLQSSQGLSLTKNSANKDEAIKFINFFVNDLDAHKIMKGERGVPINSDIQEELKPLLTPEEAKIFEYVAWVGEHSSPKLAYPVGSIEVLSVLSGLVEQILYKAIPVEEAAAKFREEATAILAKNNS